MSQGLLIVIAGLVLGFIVVMGLLTHAAIRGVPRPSPPTRDQQS